MSKRAKGGNITPADAAARVEIAEKCAMIAVPVPKAPAKPDAIQASTINEAIKGLNVEFKINLRRQDGSSSKEKISIESLDDFEESTIVKKSEALRELKRQMEFLHEFQHELQNNLIFMEELRAFVQGEKRDVFLKFLKAWTARLKKPDSQFLELLRS